MYDVLKEGGSENLSLSLLENVDYPSIGFYFANAMEKATENLWELPDALVEGTGMNSRNHHMWSSYSAYLVRSVSGLDSILVNHDNENENEMKKKKFVFRPASVDRLFTSTVSMLESNGIISMDWTNHGGIQSRKVALASNVPLVLDCGSLGGVLEMVHFVSMGTPSEEKETRKFISDPVCHSEPLNGSMTKQQCEGETSCIFSTSTDEYENLPQSCLDNMYRPLTLWVEGVCSAPLSLEVSVSVPIGSDATIVMPTHRLISSSSSSSSSRMIAVKESGQNLLDEGIKLPNGITSVHRSKDLLNRDVVLVEVGSGDYHFVVESVV